MGSRPTKPVDPCSAWRSSTRVMALAAPSIRYWIITPEKDTDAVVHSIRHSWMLDAGANARFAVATGLSDSRDASLHWLSGLNNSQVPFVAASRSDLNSQLYQTVAPSLLNQTAHAYLLQGRSSAASSPQQSQQQQVRVKQQVDKAWRITRQYNSFLRHKVFEIMREMCRSVRLEYGFDDFDYAFIMDADTAVNRTNLEAFVRPLPAKESVYTGFCKRRWSAGNKHVLRGVGGGPGILLSRPLLLRTCPALDQVDKTVLSCPGASVLHVYVRATRAPASCVPHVPQAQGSLPPGKAPRCVRRTRTSLGRAVRTAYRGAPGAPLGVG